MLDRALQNPEIAAAVAALVAAAIYAVVQIIRLIPRYVDARIKRSAALISAEAMRDRAVADAITHAASVNAQAMRVIELQTEIIRSNTGAGYHDELSAVALTLHQAQQHLKEILKRLEGIGEHQVNHLSDDFGGAG